MDIALPGLEVKELLRTALEPFSKAVLQLLSFIFHPPCQASEYFERGILILAIKTSSLNVTWFVAVQAQPPPNSSTSFSLKG